MVCSMCVLLLSLSQRQSIKYGCGQSCGQGLSESFFALAPHCHPGSRKLKQTRPLERTQRLWGTPDGVQTLSGELMKFCIRAVNSAFWFWTWKVPKLQTLGWVVRELENV